jgi:hypothetical protein
LNHDKSKKHSIEEKIDEAIENASSEDISE